MNFHNECFLRQAHQDQRGQMLLTVALMLTMLLGFSAFVVDLGGLYISIHQLQASTDAAALAGGEALPAGPSAAQAAALLYSGAPGNKNAYFLANVTMSSQVKCLTTLTNEGIVCVQKANAIQVKQQVSVPLTFGSMVGIGSVKFTATATAAMRGAAYAPYNVAIIVDSTHSMNNSDGSNSDCSGTRIQCALAGVQTLLGELAPCPSSQSPCKLTGGQATNPVDEVSLFTFPAVTSAAPDYCGGGSLSTQPYPLPTAPNYTPPSTPTYQIVNFSSDYRSSDTSTSLNTNSNLVKAAGPPASSCAGLQAKGGEGSYFASVIYAAESLLVAEQAARPNTQNALIFLSDGDANATASHFQTPPALTLTGAYPSALQQCHQTITAAQWAAQQGVGGTRVYSIGYGSESSGCSTDTTPTITPCQEMQQVASSPNNFFTDYSSSKNGCVSASRPTSTMNQIFAIISGDLTVARLIPNSTP